MADKEIWKDIEGYIGKYQVSNLGRVRSLRDNKGNKRIKILKPILMKRDGYLTVRLSKNNNASNKFVHRIVANAFIPNPNNLPQVNHKSGIKIDNRVENLEWNTAKENIKHAFDMGLHQKGSENYNAKFTNEEIKYIRKVYICGDRNYGQRALAKRYNVSQVVIYNIVHNKSYKE